VAEWITCGKVTILMQMDAERLDDLLLVSEGFWDQGVRKHQIFLSLGGSILSWLGEALFLCCSISDF
jgi:hypothetical protein